MFDFRPGRCDWNSIFSGTLFNFSKTYQKQNNTLFSDQFHTYSGFSFRQIYVTNINITKIIIQMSYSSVLIHLSCSENNSITATFMLNCVPLSGFAGNISRFRCKFPLLWYRGVYISRRNHVLKQEHYSVRPVYSVFIEFYKIDTAWSF